MLYRYISIDICQNEIGFMEFSKKHRLTCTENQSVVGLLMYFRFELHNSVMNLLSIEVR